MPSSMINLEKSTGDLEPLLSDDSGAAKVSVVAGAVVMGKVRPVTATGDDITDDTADAIVSVDSHHNYRCDAIMIAAGIIYYIGSGDSWGINGLTLTGDLRCDGEIHSFDSITGAGTLSGSGTVYLH